MITRTKIQQVTTTIPATNIIDVMIAGAIINGQRVLMASGSTVVHFDPTDENNYSKIVGISDQAAVMGDPVNVVLDGLVTSSGWGLVPDNVYYAGLNGTLTNVPPVSGISVIVGVAVDTESLKLLVSNAVITI